MIGLRNLDQKQKRFIAPTYSFKHSIRGAVIALLLQRSRLYFRRQMPRVDLSHWAIIYAPYVLRPTRFSVDQKFRALLLGQPELDSKY